MRIENPNFVDPVTVYVTEKKAAINTWLASLPTSQRYITATEIRSAFPTEAEFLSDGTIAEIAKVLGLNVE